MAISGPGWAENRRFGKFTFHRKDLSFTLLVLLKGPKSWEKRHDCFPMSHGLESTQQRHQREQEGAERLRVADGMGTSVLQPGPPGFHAVQSPNPLAQPGSGHLRNSSSKSSLNMENTTCALNVPSHCCCKPSSLLTADDGSAGLIGDRERS